MHYLRGLAIGTGLLTLLLPEIASMVPMDAPTTLDSNVCSTVPVLGLYCTGGGVTGAATFIETKIFDGARIVFLAVAILMFLQYGVRLMMESSEESTISEVKSAYTYGIAGCAIVTLAGFIVQTVGQNGTTTSALVDTCTVDTTLGKVVHFLRIMVGTAVTGVVVYQGIRLIVLQGQESEIEAQKKRFLHTLIGVAVITLAVPLVSDFMPTSGYVNCQGGGNGGSSDLAVQMIGIANFLMVIIGGLAILAMIVAGIFLIVSTDEGLKDRAKKTIFTTVIGLIVMLCTYTIIAFVMGINPTGLTLK